MKSVFIKIYFILKIKLSTVKVCVHFGVTPCNINLTSLQTPHTQLHKHQTCFSYIPYLSKWFHHLLDRPEVCFYMICSLPLALMPLFQLSFVNILSSSHTRKVFQMRCVLGCLDIFIHSIPIFFP